MNAFRRVKNLQHERRVMFEFFICRSELSCLSLRWCNILFLM
ncbi:hypothetical protein Avbf_06609 [Armadillidium vulgare]|nr:hypothetical protein Avbf_06609 [Armadillidium vulgare]